MKNRKYLHIVLAIPVLIAVSCKPSGDKRNKQQICGLASPILITGDSVKLDLNDYFNDPDEISKIYFPYGITSIKGADSGVYFLRKTGNLTALSAIDIEMLKGERYTLLVKNLKSVRSFIRYSPESDRVKDVKVRGGLNRWNVFQSKMTKNTDGMWVEEFFLPPGEYQYLLVIDGRETIDPANPDSIDNNMGGFNSLLKVGNYRQEDLPFINTLRYSIRKVELESSKDLKEIYGFWQNQRARSVLKGKSISVEIPSEARKMARSWLRITGYGEDGISNDVLIPLEHGKVVADASQLSRSDRQTMILYFMMIDRFFNGNTANDKPVDDPEINPKANYFGGDLEGIRKKLETGYFDSLGVNTLWLSPITQNPLTSYGLYPKPHTKFSGYHGYWPVSSTRIDFRLGDSSALRSLIDTVHAKNMNILLDYVASHVHELHPVFKMHPDWVTPLYLPDGTLNTEKWDEYRLTTWFDTFLPKLDLSNPLVASSMSDSALYWLETYGFDGFRHDATKHIDELFWRILTRKIKEISNCDPMPFQIGETYGSPELISSYIGSGMLDAQFDFNVYDDAVAVFARNDESFIRLKSSLTLSLRYYGYHNLMGYISGNQDRPRFISLAGGDLKFGEDAKYAGWTRDIGVGDTIAYEKLLMLQAFNLTIPGIPVIYYGDEIGLPGGNDPDNRRWMKFNGLTNNEQRVKAGVSKLSQIRSHNMALLYGDIQFLRADQEVLVYIRSYFDEIAIVVFNKSNKTEMISISHDRLNESHLKTFFNNVIIKEPSGISIQLQPESFEIIVSK